MKTASTKHLRRTILCALFAGIVAAPFAAQTAYALPIEGANAAANAGEANISTSGAVMDIVGRTDHNILKWEDFSIDSGEKVRFDGGSQTRDYLNLVTGEGASNIYGTIEGGRNVYLVNPHGILFAKDSQVNTGALYLSTANVDAVASAAGTSWGGNSPLSASTQYGNVLNLGTVQASKLYIEGKKVTVLNTDDVKNTAGNAPLTGTNVTIRSEETPRIGYDVGHKTTRIFRVNGTNTTQEVSDYASTNTDHHKASAKSRGWDVKKLNGADAHTDYDYMRVHDVYELQHMDANQIDDVNPDERKILGRYMLANDIAASETKEWDRGFQPIGDVTRGVFTGRFDGVGHTITGLTVKPPTDTTGETSRGMFAYIDHARIENVSLKGASVSGVKAVGGIVGTAEWSAIRNVSFSGEVHGGSTGSYNNCTGGIVGILNSSSIENAYHEGTVEGINSVGGIVGYALSSATVQNVRNAGKVLGNKILGGIVGTLERTGSIIENAYNEGTIEGTKAVGGIVGYAVFGSTVQNVRNAGKVVGTEMLGGIAGAVDGSSVRNALQTGTVEQRAGQTDSQVGGVVGLLLDTTVSHAVWKEGSVKDGNGALIRKGVGKEMGSTTVTDVKERSLDDMKKAATYAGWGSDIATEGGKGAPWRIYDGKTMPLLKAFLKTKHLANREQVYDGTAPTIASGDHISLDAEKNVGTYHAYSEQYDIIGGAYKVTPRALTIGAVAAQSKTYDGTTAADISKFHATLNNVVAGEESLVTATASGAAYNSKDVAAANTVGYTGVALGGTGAGNYTLAASTAQGAGSITAKQLNLALKSGARFDKTYDGTANVTQSLAKGTHYNLTGFVGSEGTGIALASSAGTYSDKNAAADKAVTFGGLTLTGTGAGNYTLDKTSLTGIGTILRRALTLGAVAAQSKTYDGNTAADASKFRAALGNLVAGEEGSVTATAGGATYNNKDVAAASTVTYTGLALTGTGAANYTLTAATAEGVGTIAKRTLTVSAVTQQSKAYDGKTDADAAQFQATLNNVVTGEEDSVTATATGAAYNDKNVAGATTVGYTGVALTGTGAGNYTVATTAEGAGTITRRALTLGEVTAQTKTYDGNTSADASKFHAALNNTVADDSVKATATGAAYNSKDVATANAVSYTGVALAGADAGNYSLAATTAQGSGTITRRTLTLGTVTAQSKTYDGTTSAKASQFQAPLNNVVAGEENSVTATATGAAYNDKNVARASKVNYTGVALTGAGAGNYAIADTAQGGGTIAQKELALALKGGARFDKTYDGKDTVDQTLKKDENYMLSNFVHGEGEGIALARATGKYADKNAGTGKTVTFDGLTLAGEGAGNYKLAADTLTTTGDIAKKTLTLEKTAGTQFTKTYNGDTAVTERLRRGTNYTLEGVVEGEGKDIVALNESAAQGAYATKNAQAAGKKQNVTFTNLALTGTGAANYTLAVSKTFADAGAITPRELTLAIKDGVRFDKTYDGNANVMQTLAKGTNYTLEGFATGEGTGIELHSGTGKYADKNAAADKDVTFDDLSLTGEGAANYVLNKTALTGKGTIAQRELMLAAVAGKTFDKTYDGTTNVTAVLKKGENYTLSNFADGEGEGITITGAGSYADKNVGKKAVNFAGLALKGEGAGNYRLNTSTLVGKGEITPRDLTLTAAPQSIVQGEALPSFTGHAEGFVAGEDESVFGADGITFGTTLTNTNTPGSYRLIGRVRGVGDGVAGNYRIRQAAGNATALTINAAALPGGLIASLVQDAAPRFDFGFGDTVYLYGAPRPVGSATLGFYRFDAKTDLENRGMRL